MPHLTCICGETINLSEIPNSHGFKVIAEPVLEALVSSLVNSFEKVSTPREFERAAYRILHLGTPGIAQAYECPQCGRLAIFGHASESIPALWFRLERQREAGLTLSSLVAEKADAM